MIYFRTNMIFVIDGNPFKINVQFRQVALYNYPMHYCITQSINVVVWTAKGTISLHLKKKHATALSFLGDIFVDIGMRK